MSYLFVVPVKLFQGDTLYSISKKFGVTVEAIQRANGIQDADLIHEGNVWEFIYWFQLCLLFIETSSWLRGTLRWRAYDLCNL